jgi:hypothetical protein
VVDFWIAYRCLLSGMCPVRNCVRMLVCLQLSELEILINLFDGREGSMFFIFLNLGDFVHQNLVCLLMFMLIDCLMAEILVGSCHCRNRGSLSRELDLNSAASLASPSAYSLPVESMCPATQVKEMSGLIVVAVLFPWWRVRCLLQLLSILHCRSPVHLWISSIRYCAG